MTVGELTAMLQRKMACDPELRERQVGVEGCDDGASLEGVSREGSTGPLWLRRADGFITKRGHALLIETE